MALDESSFPSLDKKRNGVACDRPVDDYKSEDLFVEVCKSWPWRRRMEF